MEAITVFGGLLLVVGGFVLYFLPLLIANKKKHANAIGALNLFLGWTLIGWLGALIWALMDESHQYHPNTKTCPFCAEPVKEEAIVCRYCRKDIPTLVPFMPSALPPEQEWPEPAATEPVIETRPVLRNVSANTSRCDGCGAYIPKARVHLHYCAAAAAVKAK